MNLDDVSYALVSSKPASYQIGKELYTKRPRPVTDKNKIAAALNDDRLHVQLICKKSVQPSPELDDDPEPEPIEIEVDPDPVETAPTRSVTESEPAPFVTSGVITTADLPKEKAQPVKKDPVSVRKRVVKQAIEEKAAKAKPKSKIQVNHKAKSKAKKKR